ncbi:pre-mRNA-splicing factor CWC22 homolog [Patella vulgata]|uniref:pre-mRNA-splicing factor CWC22 homolog n=1 Tax=Patella vulgata TaxID=6465 RepID=UPI0021807BAF|nr:pre-mRNA-splicing factor CWC22 homolog [Patella vulgata]
MPRKRHDTDKTSDSGEEVEKKKTIKSKKMSSKSKNKDSSSEEDSGSSDSDGSNSSSSDSSSSSSSSSSPDSPDPPVKERQRIRATKSAESGEISDSDDDSNTRKVKSSVSNTRTTKKLHDSEDSANEQDSGQEDRSKRSEVKSKRGEKSDIKVERVEEEEENFEMEPEPEWKRERNWSSDEEKQSRRQTGSREKQRISEVHLVKQEKDSGEESSGGMRTDRYDCSVSPDVSRYRDRDAPYSRDGRRDARNERDDRRNRHRDRDSEGRYDRDRRRNERNGGRYDREDREERLDRDDRYRRNNRRYQSHGNDKEREKRSGWRNDRDRREGRREDENNEKRSDRRNDRDRREGRREDENNEKRNGRDRREGRREGRREEENNKQENIENINKDGEVKDGSDSKAVVPVTKPPKDDQNIMTRTGGAYIPPARLRMMQQQITDKSSVPYQRMAWEALKKSINGLINKVNIANINFIVQELFQENIVRGRGVLARSIIQAQSASPTFTHVYAALVAIINTKFPQNGELILKRLVIQFRKGFRRNDKTLCLSSTRFLAHLVNQQVAHEVLALEILTLLLYTPTDDSVEIAVGFLKECGQKLQELSPRGVTAIFDRLRNILHEGQIDKRVQYMTEVMFAVRKDNFKDFPAVLESLDLIEEEEQFTHLLSLEQAGDPEDILNVFKADESYLVNEEKYKTLKRGILEESSSDDGSADKSGSDSSSDSDSENEDAEAKQTIIDTTETNMVVLRRTIYLTIQSSLHYEECAHKLLKMDLKPGQEVELCNMILDCCSQLRTYEKFFGLLAQRFCQMDKKYVEPFQIIFKEQYETIHRLETSKLRNVAKFFAHLLYTDAISWGVLCCISINEEDTTSASRIFIKLLFQELSEYMGLPKLNDRFKDSTLQPYFEGIMPRDNPKNTRFAINFFTTIGLGGLTEDLRNHLKDVTKQIMEKKEAEQEKEDNESSDSSDSSDSSSSSSSSSGVDSDSESSSSDESDAERKKKLRKKKEKESKKKSEKESVKDKDTVKNYRKPASTRNNGDAYTDPWERQSNRNNQHRRERGREIEQEYERDLEKAHKSKNKRDKSRKEIDEEYGDNYQRVSEKSSERYREKERDEDSDRHRDSEKSRKSHKKHQNSAEYSNSDRKRQNSDNSNSDRKRQNSDNPNSDRKKQSRNDYSDLDRNRQDRENYSSFERNRQGSAEYSKRSREDDYGRERSVDIDRYGDGNYKRIKREMNEDEYYEDSRRKNSHQDDRERSYYNHNKENIDYSPRKRRYDNSSDEEAASVYKKRSKNLRYEQSPQRSREHRRR